MATIITFPRSRGDGKPLTKPLVARVASMMVRIVWVLTVAVWPILRWVLAFDVTVQLFRMLVLFADKGIYMDWTFIAHFACFVVLVYFATMYRPQ